MEMKKEGGVGPVKWSPQLSASWYDGDVDKETYRVYGEGDGKLLEEVLKTTTFIVVGDNGV